MLVPFYLDSDTERYGSSVEDGAPEYALEERFGLKGDGEYEERYNQIEIVQAGDDRIVVYEDARTDERTEDSGRDVAEPLLERGRKRTA